MALDSRIPLMARGFQIQGPLDIYGKQLGVLGNMAQLQQAQLQTQQLQRQMDEDQAMREAVAQAGGDWQGVSRALLGRGMVKPAVEIENMMAKRQQEALATKKAKLDYDMKMAEATREVFGRMAADPSESGIVAGANELVQRDILDAAKVDEMVKRAMSMPEQMRAQWLAGQSQHINSILDAKFPKPTQFEQIGKLAGLSPEQIRQGAEAKFSKEQQWAPPSTVITMGAPTMMVDQSGTPVAVQFPNRPGAHPQVTPLPGLKPQAGQKGKLSNTALKMVQDERDALNTASTIQADMGEFVKQIDAGALKLGMVSNAFNKARNFAGLSSKESAALASFVAQLEKMRNSSLLLNKGVQTEGDAQRAWNELFANLNDSRVVRQRLTEIVALNRRAANHRQMNIEMIYRNFGLDPEDTSSATNVPAVPAAGMDAGEPPPGAVRRLK